MELDDFQRALLDSAREDAAPEVEAAWRRFAGTATVTVAAVGAGHAATKAAGWKLVLSALALGGMLGALGAAGFVRGAPPRTELVAVTQVTWAAPQVTWAAPQASVLAPAPLPSVPSPTAAPSLPKKKLAPLVATAPVAIAPESPAPVVESTPSSTLAAEIAAIDAARAAGAKGAHDEAISLASAYRAQYPSGVFAREADVLEMDALHGKGARELLAARAAAFLANFPADPHAAHVRWLTAH